MPPELGDESAVMLGVQQERCNPETIGDRGNGPITCYQEPYFFLVSSLLVCLQWTREHNGVHMLVTVNCYRYELRYTNQ